MTTSTTIAATAKAIKEKYLSYETNRAKSVVIHFQNGNSIDLDVYTSAYDRVYADFSDDNRLFIIRLYNSVGIMR